MSLPRWVPTLEGYLDVAVFLLGTRRTSLRELPRIGLAESAIHAPFAGFGGDLAYPDLIDQGAVLIAHSRAESSNKRAALLLMARFLKANGRTWGPEDAEVDAGTVEHRARTT